MLAIKKKIHEYLEREPSEHRAGRVRNLEIEHKQIREELRELNEREAAEESINPKTEQATTVGGMASGVTGQQGPDGQPGPQGQRGQQRQQGPIGAQGPQGLPGPQGPQGPQGQGAGNAGIDPDDFRAFSATVATGMTNMTATNYRKDIPQYSGDLDDNLTFEEWIKKSKYGGERSGLDRRAEITILPDQTN